MPNYVPIQELADHFKVAKNTAWAWVRSGAIPADTYVKAHRTYRFDLDRVVAALTETPPTDEESQHD